MVWKDENGEKYKISFSEELQMKNLKATKESAKWQKYNFYGKIFLGLVLLALAVTFIFFLYRLDAVDFFSKIMYR